MAFVPLSCYSTIFSPKKFLIYLGDCSFFMLWIWFILAMGGEWQLFAAQTFPVIHGVSFVSALKEALHMLPSRKEK